MSSLAISSRSAPRSRTLRRATGSPARAISSAAIAATAAPAASICAATRSRASGSTGRAPSPSTWRFRPTTPTSCPTELPDDIGAILDPFGNAAHTALSFDLVGEDVLITGAGPIGIMAGAISKKIGARHIVITDVNPYRLELAEDGRLEPVDVTATEPDERDGWARHAEGFDVGLEMSGNQRALNDMLRGHDPRRQVALLGIPPEERRPSTGTRSMFKGLTLKGIYGREMFETWYKMVALIQEGLDISPILTHRFPIDRFQEGFEIMASGQSGKIVLDWT